MSDEQKQKPIERKEYRLSIDIIQGGELKKAGTPVKLRPDQFARLEEQAKRQAAMAKKEG